MTISRRGIFGALAGAVAAAKAPIEQSATAYPTSGVYHEGRLFLKHGHRAADPILLDADDGSAALFRLLSEHPDLSATEVLTIVNDRGLLTWTVRC